MSYFYISFRFYDCLCAEENSKCNLKVDRSYSTYLPVINVTKVTNQPEHLNLYQPTYVCQLPSLHETESTITCARSMKSYDQVCDGLRHCHIHQLNFTQMRSCDRKCINIIMSNSPDVYYLSNDILPIPTENHSGCVMKTPTTVAAPLAVITATPPPTSDNTSTEERNTYIAIGVILGVAVLVTIVVTIILAMKNKCDVARQ